MKTCPDCMKREAEANLAEARCRATNALEYAMKEIQYGSRASAQREIEDVIEKLKELLAAWP